MFHRARTAAVAAVLSSVASIAAPGSAPAAEMAAESEISPVVGSLLENLERTGEKLVALAEAMPADKFSWRPTDEVRTVSEVYMHVASANLLMPVALGATPPASFDPEKNPFEQGAAWEADITTKEAVIEKLRSSFEYVGQALGSIRDLDTEVTVFGPPQPKRDYFMILLGHAHEHLGQSIAYARSTGVVPPWSRPPASDDGDGDGDG